MTLRVANWDTYQHYRDRKPPWLKLHRSLIDNVEYARLSDRTARYLPLIWIIASDDDGFLPCLGDVAFRLRIDQDAAAQVLGELTEAAFLGEVEGEGRADTEWAARYIPKAVRIAVWKRDRGRCVQCGSRDRIEFDHVVPTSKGGTSDEQNVQLLCRSCNRRKHNKMDCAEQDAPSSGAKCSPETEAEGEREAEGEADSAAAAAVGFSLVTQTARRPTAAKAPGRETWLTPYVNAWKSVWPESDPLAKRGQLVKVLRPLDEKHGPGKVVPELVAWLRRSDPSYLDLSKFGAAFGTWAQAVRPAQRTDAAFDLLGKIRRGEA